MRSIKMTLTLALILGLAAAGCDSDDGGGTAADTSIAADTSTPTDTAVGGDSSTADTSAETDTGAVADTSTADTTPPDPNDPCNRQFTANVAYLTEIALGNLGDDDTCCFDFTGDGVTDNKLGDVVKLIQGLPQIERDVNTVMAENIADGTFTVLFELTDLESLQSDGDVTIDGFYGEDTDTDHANNLAGQGTFTANLSSFKPNTNEPRIHFDGVTITNGSLAAGPAVFRLEIPLANGLELAADIDRTRLEAVVSAGPSGGVAMTGVDGRGAKLGGIIAQDDLFGALNGFVGSFCSCLDTGSTQALVKSGETWGCATMNKGTCDPSDSTQAMCGVLADACGLALALVTPDIDTDESGSPDAFSLGFFLKTTGGQIVGVEPTTCGN